MGFGKSMKRELGVEVSGSVAAAGGDRWRRRRWGVVLSDWPLLIFFVVLQVADVVTTNSALALPGNAEGNPLMAAYQANLGAAWWAPKVAVIGLAWVLQPLMRRQWPMICAISYYAMIVSGNMTHL
jgi:hypothetical protein